MDDKVIQEIIERLDRLENKKSRKLQYSKVITSIILAIIVITWLYGIYVYRESIDYFYNILQFVQAMALGVMPYFCLSAVDRIQYMIQTKYRKGE